MPFPTSAMTHTGFHRKQPVDWVGITGRGNGQSRTKKLL